MTPRDVRDGGGDAIACSDLHGFTPRLSARKYSTLCQSSWQPPWGLEFRGIWVTGWEARFRVVVLFQYAPPCFGEPLVIM
jgi:hypothetical protein